MTTEPEQPKPETPKPEAQTVETKEIISKRDNNPVLGQYGFEFDFNSAVRFAQGLVSEGMAPKGMKAGGVLALIEAGKEMGLAPMYALGNLTIINGRTGIMGDAAKAKIRRSGVLKPGTDFVTTYSGEELTESWTCTVSAHREGMPEPFSSSFSIKQAIQAGLVRIWTFPKGSERAGEKQFQSREKDGFGTSGPWATYTYRQLMYRALGFLARDYFSDVLGCAVIMEEFADYPRSVTNGATKAELVRRFAPEGAVDVAAIYAPPCDHSSGPVERITPSDVPDEPDILEEVCAGCQVPWKGIMEARA